jgi:predicted ATPase/DNA-binding winged helix-turn-helix (wHTH) protein
MEPTGSTSIEAELAFGPYRLKRSSRILVNEGRPVPLSGRAFDLLLVLLERAGEVVSKDELIARVWPNTVVEEHNLRVHIGTLRKVLGGGHSGLRYVENVVGRGYSFVAPVAHCAASAPPPITGADARHGIASPPPSTGMIGRDDALRRLTALISQHRCVTIVGPGGVGKSTIALALAEALAPQFGQRIYYLDLAPLTDGGQVATTLGMAMPPFPPDRRSLLILDNCERLIDHAAALAARLLADGAPLHILATSREPLRARDERLHRLAPLAVPAYTVTREAALSYPAVRLFTERAMAGAGGIDLSDHNLRHIIEICRRLDGLPLAIELAAGRADFFGIAGLAVQLEDCLGTLVRGPRTAPARHQSLRAALDWSYDLLPAHEQALLQRVCVFHGGFTLDAAADLLACDGFSRALAVEAIAGLHAKSLLDTDDAGDTMRYRLLRTTRAYVLEKLAAADAMARVSPPALYEVLRDGQAPRSLQAAAVLLADLRAR